MGADELAECEGGAVEGVVALPRGLRYWLSVCRQPGIGLTPSEVSTTVRPDGTPQVTYNGHPLYLFTADTKPGDANGNGVLDFGGVWSALSPAGESAITAAVPVSPGAGY